MVTPGARRLLLAVAAATLVLAVAGGLLRAGLGALASADAFLVPRAAVSHAALLISGFFGTVIGIERAVALGTRSAYLAPFLAALGAVLLLAGFERAGAASGVLAAVAFTLVNAALVRKQPAAHTAMLLVSAVAWLAGNTAFALRLDAIAWGFAFLVLTIAAERLEMTRLARRRRGSRAAFFGATVLLLAGAAASTVDARAGGTLYGVALVLVAAWLGAFDIARRTVAAPGLPRYMAVCLLSGYAWLAIGGVAWIAMAHGAALRDLAFHAIGLGFVTTMVMAHAPVILPAVARIRVRFDGTFYLPLVLLHVSLLVRAAAAGEANALRLLGAQLNALALAVFVAVVAVSAMRRRQPG
jgi:hypothetical protein